MKKDKLSKRLVLGQETLRLLTEIDLRGAQGGQERGDFSVVRSHYAFLCPKKE